MSSKSSNKGNRVTSLLEQLNKHWKIPLHGRLDEHDVENIRYLTGKIQQLVSSQEKCRKDLIANHEQGINMLLSILRGLSTVDLQISYNILSMLNEVLTSGKRTAIVIDHDAVKVIFNVLDVTVAKEAGRESQLYEDVITVLHTLLSKLGNKDKGFSVQARLTGAVSLTLILAKHYLRSFKVLLPLLQVLRIYGNSSANCTKMVKEGAVGLLVKVLPQCGLKRTVTLKLTLDLLANLVKTKNGAKKAVVAGGVPVLLSMFLEWQRLDHRNRQVNLRKAILTCLRGIISCSAGRKALSELDGLKVFYTTGYDALELREMDGITKLLILILRRMVTRKLMLKRSAMLLIFSIRGKKVETKLKKVDSRSSQHKTANHDTASIATSEHDESDAESDDECAVDIQEEDEESQVQETTPQKSPVLSVVEESPGERTDLHSYRVFMPEFDEFEMEAEFDNQEPTPATSFRFPPVVIPTASMETDLNIDNLHSSSENSKDDKCSWPTKAILSTPVDPCMKERELQFERKLNISSKSYNNNNTPLETSVNDSQLQKEHSSIDCSSSEREWASCGTTTTGQGVTALKEGDLDEDSIAYGTRDIILQYEEDGPFHLLPFVKKPDPEIYGHYPPTDLEPLLDRKPGLPRVMVFQDFARFLNTDKIINKVVYDLDDLIKNPQRSPSSTSSDQSSNSSSSSLTKDVPVSTSSSTIKQEQTPEPLVFESRFECGNLRRAIQIRSHEYDLVLSPDINTDHHHQWFYFEVQNMESGVPYKFNIINCEKFNSQFNFGMQPVLYSTKEALIGRPGWERVGYNVCYYKNFFVRAGIGQTSMRYFYTTTFTLKFPHANDVCYIAYHYPYSFSMLQGHLSALENKLSPSIYFSRQTLCKSLLGNACDLLTITGRPNINDTDSMANFRKRPYIVLTCRVHPGESSSSWLMKGVLDYLLSSEQTAASLRSTYIFKIVPMLNPDGVINGCHRCGVAGEDLNRKWINPDPKLYPTIYHIKGLIQYLISVDKTPLVYCDFHGHSRRKNVFMYGCSMASTANARAQGNTEASTILIPKFGELKTVDNPENGSVTITVTEEDNGYRTLPKILNSVAPAFAIQNCNFVVEKSKEGTGRVVVYKELGVLRSYTLESTYCGADQGLYKGYHFSTRELEEMGKHFCVGLQKLSQSYKVKLNQGYFREPQLESPSETELGKTADDDDFSLEDLSSTTRLDLGREPLLQGILSSNED